MIYFLGHGSKSAAGGVALGWVSLGFIFAFCLPFFCGNTHLLCMCWTKHDENNVCCKNMPFLGTYMAQLTCFEWKLSHLSPAFCI